MARTNFRQNKLQKERARKAKQLEKEQRRAERAAQRTQDTTGEGDPPVDEQAVVTDGDDNDAVQGDQS